MRPDTPPQKKKKKPDKELGKKIKLGVEKGMTLKRPGVHLPCAKK